MAFHGHVVSGKGVKVDPKKTYVAKSYPRPLYPSDIPSFLGLDGTYRKFVEGFLRLPLHWLHLPKKVRFYGKKCVKIVSKS